MKCRQIAALQVVPASQQFPALPFQLLELPLFGFGGRGIRGARSHRQKRPLAV